MSKKVFFNQDARVKLQKGINIAGDATGSTLGAQGKSVIISSGYGHMPTATKDGVTVIKSIFLEDEVENTGVMLVRGAAEKTLDLCGDGTTTSVVLAQSILNDGLLELHGGNGFFGRLYRKLFGHKKCNIQEVKSGIDKAVLSVTETLKSMAVPVVTNATIKSVATVSANNDVEIGRLIADAYDKIGLNGLLTIEDSKTIDTHITVLEGAEMPRGYASDQFCTDYEKMLAVYENPMILVLDYEVKRMKELEPIMKKIAASTEEFTRPWIIIARGFDGEVHNTFIVNKNRNKVPVCLICAPVSYQKEALRDVACLTGATVVCDEKGKKIEHATPEFMGTCAKIVVSKTSTMIIGGDTDIIEREQIIKEVNLEIKETDNAQVKEVLEKRLARLTGSIGVMHVGGVTDVERKERKDRVDDAVRAVRSAIEEGIVVGGGVSLIRCIDELDNISVHGDESIGVDLIRKACMAPLKKMLDNAGLDDDLAYEVLNYSTSENYGYNVKIKAFGDLFEQGIIDPVKVVRCAMQNAASVASQVLTGDVLLVEMRPAG
ncbi:MAG: chaperonin GroEL [Bacteroidota bacterium]